MTAIVKPTRITQAARAMFEWHLERQESGYSAADVWRTSTMTREQIITAAIVVHDSIGCRCDRKYIMSCKNMTVAILSLASRGFECTDGDVEAGEGAKLDRSDIL